MEVSNAKTWKGIIHVHFWKKVSCRFRNSVSFIPISNSIYYSVRQQRIVFDRIFYFLLFSIISLRHSLDFRVSVIPCVTEALFLLRRRYEPCIFETLFYSTPFSQYFMQSEAVGTFILKCR